MTTDGKIINIAAACAQHILTTRGFTLSLLELVPFIQQAFDAGYNTALQGELNLETVDGETVKLHINDKIEVGSNIEIKSLDWANAKTEGFTDVPEYDQETKEQAQIERYRQAAHAVQTGIAFAPDKTDQTPKHLRVGVDLSKSDMSGLIWLLMEKKLFTRLEYFTAIADAAEVEAESRAAAIGPNVTTR